MSGVADPWQVIADVTSELIRGGQTADIRCRAALGVLGRAGIDFDGNPVAAARREWLERAGLDEGARADWADVAADACIAETSRREGAEGKLAEAVLLLGAVRELMAYFLAAHEGSDLPAYKGGQDLANAALKIIDADAPTDDDESPRLAATERSKP